MGVIMDNYEYERNLYLNGVNYIAGVDEVGRGPLIGPVVSACVILPKDFIPEGLTDSKKLSEHKRDYFYNVIKENALGIGIGIVSPEEIDEINIYEASKKSMMLAIFQGGKSKNIFVVKNRCFNSKTSVYGSFVQS